MTGDAALDRLRRHPATTVVATDFDGTLSRIVDDPAAARPVDGAVAVLSALTEHYAAVAVLSGRPVSFLQQWLPAGIELRGLYGLEAVQGGQRVDHAAAGAWRSVIDDVAADAAALEGVNAEHKGLSLTLHYRTDPTAAAAAATFAEGVAERTGLALRPARMSIELHPPVAVDKGTALTELVASVGATAACFIGDDAGDLPAFTALVQLGSTGVKVAVRSPESPPELLERADVVVDGPDGVVAFLLELLGPPEG